MSDLREAFLVDGLRTPFGKYRGALSNESSVDLGAAVIAALVKRNPWAARPDAALMGVVIQAGLGQNPARIAAVRGGVSMSTPALTLNGVCLASLEAACDATRRIRLGEGASYLVGGFDSMSRAPGLVQPEWELTERVDTRSSLMTDGLGCALAGESMGSLSDRVNRELRISRADQDAWAAMSHARAAAARGVTEREELTPVRSAGVDVMADQGIRATSVDALASLKLAFSEAGTITAGNSSQMSDGASAGLIVSGAYLQQVGATPMARIVDWGWVAGPDASLHLKPAMAIRLLLEKRRLKATDIDLFEINEAFAGVSIATARALGLDAENVNVNGGAIALGHPLGASGFRLLLTLALEMRRRKVKRGIATLCGGGGQALAVLIENCDL
jgi:acetyl-CoA C-acetyltransferase